MDIRVPNLGEGAESGTVVTIHVKEGDKISKDQTLVELENEKAVAPIPSPESGVVQKIYVKPGQKVSVGQPLIALAGSEGPQAPPIPFVKPQATAPSPVSASPEAVPFYQPVPGIPVAASPTVRKIAEDLSLDLSKIRGSEAGGRIVLADLRNYIQKLEQAYAGAAGAAPKTAASESIDFSKWGSVSRKPLSSLRQKISERMLASWTTIPHVTQFDEAAIAVVTALRKKYAPAYKKKGVKLTLTSFVMKAVVDALKKYPVFNASLDEASGDLVLKEYFHLGIAVDTEAGLLVPVIRDVDKKDLFEISKELEVLAEKTRQRKVSAEELKGGSFTISNLGGIGGSHFTPIINKPELAILGVGRGVDSLPLSLSYDHRVIDGAQGARFTRAVAESIEHFNEKEVKI